MSSFLSIDPSLVVAGLLVGLLVGLTGMGGGALLTPILVLVFGVAPLAAISSDLVTSLVMKPVGAAVHLRRGTVQTGLVKWLVLGAVPSGFVGAVLVGTLGRSSGVQSTLKTVIGAALVVSLLATLTRLVLDRRGGTRDHGPLVVRPGVTVAIGVVGGLAVGITSVGAGSLIIALLLLAYPGLTPSKLVGTDIVQAIPLVGAAALGHLLFGDVQLAVTASLLVGALPAIYVGARLSAQAPSTVIRPVVSAVLLASALALLKAPTSLVVSGALAAALVTVLLTRPGRRPAEDDRVPLTTS
ncbi:sulfite exporter TauE/SafE family protein [Rhodococcus aerolatus]